MAEMEINNSALFNAFLEKHLRADTYDMDAYLEKLIIHWGETGEEQFTLSAEETLSGKAETIAFSVKTRYYIYEDGKEVPVEDLSGGYDIYRPVLQFFSSETVEPVEIPPTATLNPIALLRHKSGRTLKSICAATNLTPEALLEYEKPGFDVGQLPLSTAASIAKALGVHAEALLSCGPAMPHNH